ncbi:hypothetical protein TNCV_2049501 [Trichonephila clavipes]|nr:hypothetical protein TNCV_2049501 [Trichonephila clavipes]
MRDSSVKINSFHSATHILLSSYHWRWRRLWFCVKGRQSNGHLADGPLCCKRRRMDDKNAKAMPISNSIVSRRIDEMSEDIEMQLV